MFIDSRDLKAGKTYTQRTGGEFWGELKFIFADIQGDGKCAYCERKLDRRRPSEMTGIERAVGDIEHYRPKGGVIEWTSPDGIATGTGDTDCYYLLAFHLRNYLLACEVCNEDFKKNFFPIAGPRADPHSRRMAALQAERPYLIHPLDSTEPDAEALIMFHGINIVPRAPGGTDDHMRALITIRVLGLASEERYKLVNERLRVIETTYLALIGSEQGNTVAEKVLRDIDDNTVEHRNCARSFRHLYYSNPDLAEKMAIEAREYMLKLESQRDNRRKKVSVRP